MRAVETLRVEQLNQQIRAADPNFKYSTIGTAGGSRAGEIQYLEGVLRSKAGRYEFPDQSAGGVPYVGQSGNIPSRLNQHERAGRYVPGTASVIEVQGGKTAREISEHQRIQEITGGVPASQSRNVSNKVDPIGPKRKYLLGE
jgi:hypothetical protein